MRFFFVLFLFQMHLVAKAIKLPLSIKSSEHFSLGRAMTVQLHSLFMQSNAVCVCGRVCAHLCGCPCLCVCLFVYRLFGPCTVFLQHILCFIFNFLSLIIKLITTAQPGCRDTTVTHGVSVQQPPRWTSFEFSGAEKSWEPWAQGWVEASVFAVSFPQSSNEDSPLLARLLRWAAFSACVCQDKTPAAPLNHI